MNVKEKDYEESDGLYVKNNKNKDSLIVSEEDSDTSSIKDSNDVSKSDNPKTDLDNNTDKSSNSSS